MPRFETTGNDPLRNITKAPKPQAWQSDENLFAVCEALYQDLLDGSFSDEPGVNRWAGPVSNWFREHKKTNLYTPIMYLMKEMGACYVETVGSRWMPTIVRLGEPPTLEKLKKVRRDHFFYNKPVINRRDTNAMILQAIDDLRNQMNEITNRVERLEND